MKEIEENTFPKIYLFEHLNGSTKTNPLKDYLYFLKFNGARGVIDFSYSNACDTLHTSLTIKENFALEAIPLSLIKDTENNLNEFLKEQKNPHLHELIDYLGCMNKTIKELTSDKVKLVTLIKALLSGSEYVFLKEPESQFDGKILNALKRSISHEAITNSRKFFITPVNVENWVDISTHFIKKCPETKSFHIIQNVLNNENHQIELTTPYKFKLIKQAS